MKIHSAGIATLLLAATASAHASHPRPSSSLYTSIAGEECVKTVDDASTGASTLNCPGIGGFRLQVLDDDDRSSIDVVTPGGAVLPLDYWELVSTGFSSLGGKAEWRVRTVDGKKVPFALIVRVNTIDERDLERTVDVSYLAVAKIRSDLACVVTRVDARLAGANARARAIADTSDKLPCLPVTPDSARP